MGDPIRIRPAASAISSNIRREGLQLRRASGILRGQSRELIVAAHEALDRAERAMIHSGQVRGRCAAGAGRRRSRMRTS